MRILNLKFTIAAICLFAVIMATFGVHGENQNSDVRLSQPKAIHLPPVFADWINSDPEDINEDGIDIEFSEPVKKATVDVTVDGEALKWAVEMSDDAMTATAIMLPGGELPYESEVVVVVNAEDAAGNPMEETEITFTTAAKEE